MKQSNFGKHSEPALPKTGRKLKHYRRAYAAGKIELSAISRSLASYRGHLSHGHTWNLRNNLMKHFVLKKGKDKK